MTEHTCSRFAVLILEGALYVLHCEAKVGELVGLHVDLHGVVAASDVADAAYTWHAAQKVEYVEGGVVTQIYLIVFGVVRHQSYGHELVGCLFFHADTVLHHFGGQS